MHTQESSLWLLLIFSRLSFCFSPFVSRHFCLPGKFIRLLKEDFAKLPIPLANTFRAPALGGVLPVMMSGAERWVVSRHTIKMNSTEWSLIFSGQAQFSKGIKVKESCGELDLEGCSSL